MAELRFKISLRLVAPFSSGAITAPSVLIVVVRLEVEITGLERHVGRFCHDGGGRTQRFRHSVGCGEGWLAIAGAPMRVGALTTSIKPGAKGTARRVRRQLRPLRRRLR